MLLMEKLSIDPMSMTLSTVGLGDLKCDKTKETKSQKLLHLNS